MTTRAAALITASALALTALPATAAAQSPTPSTFSKTAIAAAVAANGTTTTVPRITRRGRYLLVGALVGAGVGVVFGEVVLGWGLDMAHGPDMVFGAAIGAGVGLLSGTLLAKAVGANVKPGAGIGLTPIVGRGRKGLFVTLPIGSLKRAIGR